MSMLSTGGIKIWNIVTLVAGCSILIFWTLFRFATKPINFDQVGQQLIARQWLEGNLEGATIGPTNYVLKILFLYMPAELVNVDPKLFLLISTIFVNIATYVGIYFALKCILKFFSIEAGALFSISMLWLSAVAGSVFWVQFTNSRNLEVVAGLFLLYLGLLIYRKPTWRRLVFFLVLASLTYFTDPMQLFVTSTIIVTYVSLQSILFQRDKPKEPLLIILLIIGGYLLSQLLIRLLQEITRVDIISTDTLSHSLAVFSNIPTVAVETVKNIIRLVAGTNEMGSWRQIINVIIVGLLGIASIMFIYRNQLYKKQQSFLLFVLLMIAVPVAVYVASGQPVFGGDTSRYLIMLAPALVLFFAISDTKRPSVVMNRLARVALLPLLCVSVVVLVYAAISTSIKSTFAITSLESRYSYLDESGYSYGYASMDTAIPAMYLYGKDSSAVLLPLSCERGGRLRKTTLFYDKKVFMDNEGKISKVPIILDGSSISNYPNRCSVKAIKAQLGAPLAVDTSRSYTVLIYDSAQLEKLGF